MIIAAGLLESNSAGQSCGRDSRHPQVREPDSAVQVRSFVCPATKPAPEHLTLRRLPGPAKPADLTSCKDRMAWRQSELVIKHRPDLVAESFFHSGVPVTRRTKRKDRVRQEQGVQGYAAA